MTTIKTHKVDLVARGSSFGTEDLQRMSEGTLFESSPRFPAGPMRLVDRVTEVSADGGKYGKGLVVGELDISSDMWFFGCHFLSDPVMPGCLGLDAMWQLSGFFMAWYGWEGRSRALGVGKVRFRNEVSPNAKLVTYRIDIRRFGSRPLPTVVSDGTMLVDGEEAYYASNLMLGFRED